MYPGEYGHIRSFIAIITDAKKNKYKTIRIFEPDVYLCHNFNEKFDIVLTKLPEWKLFYIGSMQGYYYGSPTWSNVVIKEGVPFYSCYKTLGTFGICIDCSIFDEIIVELEKLEFPTDVVLCSFQEKYPCFTAYPNLVCSDVSSSGTALQTAKNQVEYMEKYRWKDEYIFKDIRVITGKKTFTVNSKLPGSSIVLYSANKIIRTINDPQTSVVIDYPGEVHIEFNRCFGEFNK
jgi:GR25 family glycosyltransferase involved in LPS biosynthesis